MGPAPIVPGQHFRPAANGPPARPSGSNGFARPPRPQQNGPLQYGNAAKGIRPPANKGLEPPSNDPQAKFQILRNVLADNGTSSLQGLHGTELASLTGGRLELLCGKLMRKEQTWLLAVLLKGLVASLHSCFELYRYLRGRSKQSFSQLS